MTNGMLFTPRQWASFPALHRRVKILKISVDAATGPTHELLRRGARWPTMLENMAFAGELTARGEIAHFELVVTVQKENYREMGDAVDLAKQVGATGIYFARITNWGTFTEAEYREKAVFLATHEEHDAFLRHMQDPRLREPMVVLGDLQPFVEAPIEAHCRVGH
jgi:MoaA/NifB/PqqE/SkfB family radical SAM enzyme